MADSHTAAVLELEPGLLAGDQDRFAALALGLDPAAQEADRTAGALGVAVGAGADDRLEAPHAQAGGICARVALPVHVHRVEHGGRAGDEGLSLIHISEPTRPY